MAVLTVASAMRLGAQGCIVGGHVPSAATCVVSEYIDFLVRMAAAEKSAADGFPDSVDVWPRAFASIKARLGIEREVLTRLASLIRTAKDTSAREAAIYVARVIQIMSVFDSTAQEDARRILRMQMPLAELEEKRGEQQQRRDQTLRLLVAAGGAAIDGTVIFDGGKAARRRMTEAERDTLARLLTRHFGKALARDSDGQWASGWASVASALHDALMARGWTYLPPPTP